MQPLDVQSTSGNYETYTSRCAPACRSTRALTLTTPTFIATGPGATRKTKASMKQIRAVLHDNAELGNVLVLGAGAGRLAYDIHTQL